MRKLLASAAIVGATLFGAIQTAGASEVALPHGFPLPAHATSALVSKGTILIAVPHTNAAKVAKFFAKQLPAKGFKLTGCGGPVNDQKGFYAQTWRYDRGKAYGELTVLQRTVITVHPNHLTKICQTP